MNTKEASKKVKDHIVCDGSTIPILESRRGGTAYRNNIYYIQSAEREAKRLVDNLDCSAANKLLDVGCGRGRLATGILRIIGELNYTGIDVDSEAISWCQRYIADMYSSFKFRFIDVKNQRYNPKGVQIDKDFAFEFEDKSFDIIYLCSVFSHMHEQETRIYLKDFKRLLVPTGQVFFTAFVEDNVSSVSVNPDNYFPGGCDGPLHVVRYEKNYLLSLLKDLGFEVLSINRGTVGDQQSEIYLSVGG